MDRVRHVVLVKFREDLEPAERKRFVDRVRAVGGLSYVSGFRSGWGVPANAYEDASESWDWGFTLDFGSDDVLRYATDPLHQAVGADVADHAERYAILDFAIDPGDV